MIYILFIGKVLLVVLSLLFLYLLCAFIIPIFPVNRKFQKVSQGVKIYIVSNGIHADFLLPVSYNTQTWGSFLDFSHYENKNTIPTYIGVGWGDRGFYLDTPTWAELKFKTAVNAMLWPSPTVMHISTYDEFPKESRFWEEIEINSEQYDLLCKYIQKKFRKDKSGKIELLSGVGYTPQDNFYEANGSYHALNTCNTWINRGLLKIGVRTALWSPHDRGIFYQLQKIG